MPNHITNRLKIVGIENKINKVFDFIKIEEQDATKDYRDKLIFGIGTIDFNKITPMPKWVFRGNLGRAEEQKYGAENCWYKWSLDNWGTKWNAYEQLDERNTDDTIYFNTAWSKVDELIRKLSLIFPDVIIEYAWADEDFGANIGFIELQNGQIIKRNEPNNFTKEAYDLAFKITKTTPEEHNLKFNNEQQNYTRIEI
ncbi:MAG: hypothetical protein WC389_13830 [Lutibacter sp.]|jgi:hypothetical protein